MLNSRPNVYLFNPTCEYAIANGNSSWRPNQILQKMETDLATLPLFFAGSNDYVVVEKLPSEQFIASLELLDIEIPNFILKSKINNQRFLELKKNKLIPWGWSPAAHKLLEPLKSNCSIEFKNSPIFNWHKQSRDLYSKKFASEILSKLTFEFPNEYFIPQSHITQVRTSQKQIEILLEKWGKIMVKAPWSSSGRGLQSITKKPVHEKVWEKLLGIVREQGYVIVEPFLDKALDLAFLFKLVKGQVIYLGISNFITDRKGQYLGNNLNGLPENINEKIKEFAKIIPEIIIKPLSRIIEQSKLAKYYEGYFGVDTLVYFDEQKELKVNPCLEINVKYSMGLLSLYLEKLLAENKKGIFRIYYKPNKTFSVFKKEMEEKHPLKVGYKKIESGFFALTEANENTLFGAYLLI